MSRELLKRVLDELDIDRDTYGTLCKEIETYLAQPEPVTYYSTWIDEDGNKASLLVSSTRIAELEVKHGIGE